MKKATLHLASKFLFLGIIVSISVANASAYSDVPASHWAYDAIQSMTAKEIMQGTGDGLFKSDGLLSRAEFLAAVARAMMPGQLDSPVTSPWYAASYRAALKAGLIEETAMPNTPHVMNGNITRNEMARILIRADENINGYNSYAYVFPEKEELKDLASIPSEYVYDVKEAYSRGLLSGYSDGTFRGEQPLTRAQSAAVIKRLLAGEIEILTFGGPNSIQEFQQGKTLAAMSGDDNLWVLQEDGTLWGKGRAYGWTELDRIRSSILGKGNVYDYAVHGTKDRPERCWQTYPIKLLENVKQFEVYDNYDRGSIWAVQEDGSLWGAGFLMNDNSHVYENGFVDHQYTPDFTKVLDGVESVNAESSTILVVKKDHTLWGWDSSAYSQLGTEHMEAGNWYTPAAYHEKPIQIMDDVKKAAASGLCSFAIKTDGSLWSWGTNRNGQLGTGAQISEYHDEIIVKKPTKVMDDVVDVQAYYARVMALKDDGSLWVWGAMPGYFSNDKPGFQNTPVKIAEHVTSFYSSESNTLIAKDDGTLWYLDEDYNHHTAEFKRNRLSDVASVGQNVALKTDGSLWACEGYTAHLIY